MYSPGLMNEAVQGRREQRRLRTQARRRHRIKVAAAATLGGAVVLGTAGAAAGGDRDLRASAGIQLASLALPLFSDSAASDPTAAPGTPAAESSAAVPAEVGTAGPAPEAADEAAAAASEKDAVDKAAEDQAAEDHAAEQRAAEEAAAAQHATEQAAAETAAAEAARAASVPVNDPAAAKAYAATALPGHGWGPEQMTCLDTLWTKESEWLTSATNAGSGAYGIPQALPGAKIAAAGGDWQTNYQTQINWGLTYIESRYGSPCSALNFHYANNWY